MKRDASVTFPKLIHCGSDEAVTAECESLGFDDEARAYMFAEVARYCFPIDAEVIETPAGWGVVVSCDHRGIDENVVSQLQGACQVLMHYAVDLDNGADALECLHHNPAPVAREAWHNRKNAQQQRIEDGINAILAHLGHPTATPAAAEAHAADPHNGVDDWTLDEIRKRIRGNDDSAMDRDKPQKGDADGTADY